MDKLRTKIKNIQTKSQTMAMLRVGSPSIWEQDALIKLIKKEVKAEKQRVLRELYLWGTNEDGTNFDTIPWSDPHVAGFAVKLSDLNNQIQEMSKRSTE